MILTIRHLSGSLAGKSQRIALKDGQVLRLGRAAESDILFSDSADDTVSGVHAELSLEGSRLVVEDKRSANGTFVNGAACPPFQKVTVPDGSRIRLAKLGPEMQVVVESAQRGAAAGSAAPAAATATGTAVAKESVGRQTLLREIDRARQEERDLVSGQIAGTRRNTATLLAAGLGGVLLLGALGFGGYAWWSGNTAREREAALAAEQARQLQEATNPWPAVERKVSPSVVQIRCGYLIRALNGVVVGGGASTGSGVQIQPGLILTARHVVEPWRFDFKGEHETGRYDPANPLTWSWDEIKEKTGWTPEYDVLEVQFPGQRPLTARLMSGDGERPEDLALLQIQSTTAPTVEVGPGNDGVAVTEEIAIIGYPGDLGRYSFAVTNSSGVGKLLTVLTDVVPTFMRGTVAQPLTATGDSSHRLFFDASIEPGSSGGPVVNRRGELIGIVSWQFQRSDIAEINGNKVQTWQPMEAGSVAVSPDDIRSFLRSHGIL